MISDTLVNAAAIMEGKLLGDDGRYLGLSTDTRTLRPEQLFFALQGPNFDGGAFVDQAAKVGAAGAVVRAPVKSRIPLIRVSDTRRALGRLTAAWRRQLSVTVIGLTGSNGKTTLKALIANCLSTVATTTATRGNLNNEIGVPLTLGEIGPEHRFAVVEMGANHAGEIAWLTSLAQPDVVVITNAAPAHLEGFGSVAGVARAKGEILQGSVRPRRAILNADDAHFSLWRSMAADLEVTSFGLGPAADVRAVRIETTASGSDFALRMHGRELPVSLRLPGRHNVVNACAAAAVAAALEVDDASICDGLEATEPVAGRLSPLPAAGGATIYDDSYNANPASVVAAAEFIAAQRGESWLVLGDMGELGADSEKLHRQVGESARKAGVSRLFATGPLMRHAVDAFGVSGCWFDSVETLIDALRRSLKSDVSLLVKGSRATHMERVVHALRNDHTERRRA
jgi:UDP-N-acetylmuramoyl-tripeptide--D-alanyl-D-alanine ligase